MCFLNHHNVSERGRRPLPREAFSLLKSELFVHADEQRAHHERLIFVVGDGFGLKDDVAAQKRSDVDGVATFEEPAGCSEPEAADADVDETSHVAFDILAITDVVNNLTGGLLKVE